MTQMQWQPIEPAPQSNGQGAGMKKGNSHD